MPNIFTLLSDFGTKDYTLSVWKASLLNEFKNCLLIDISHEIEPYNILEAFYVFSNSYKNFPEGTIHIIGLEAVYQKNTRILLAKKNNHFFISTDNGLLSLLDSKENFEFIKEYYPEKFDDFLVKNTFIHLIKEFIFDKKAISYLNDCTDFKELKIPQPSYKEENKTLFGTIIYIDHFGNAITNISKTIFEEYIGNKTFEINANFRFIDKIYNYYEQISETSDQNSMKYGEIMAVFNDANFLEIVIYKSNLKTVGGASSLLGLTVGKEIKILIK